MLNVIVRALFLACLCTFLTIEATSFNSIFSGDIRIQTLPNGSIDCDSMTCPEGTTRCRVTKENDPQDFDTIVRSRKCFGKNDEVVKEELVFEENKSHERVSQTVETSGGSYIGGRQMTPEEQKAFEERMKKMEEDMNAAFGGFGNWGKPKKSKQKKQSD